MTQPPGRVAATFRVNGVEVTVDVEPRRTLADVLRDRLRLTGTHLGCEHGVCGSCTVLLDGAPVRSCLTFAVQADEQDVTTVEAEDDVFVRRAQDAVVAERAIQCGFCTPGFVMLLAGLQRMGWQGNDDELATVLASNLCRCTGYQGLMRAARRLLRVAPARESCQRGAGQLVPESAGGDR
jgi:aerobic carbon-monoxide dehydrogenase small subunit